MPKRLHDSGLWSKPWFRVLSPAEKCAFQYLIDHCDGAGVWDADFEAAEFVIGDVVRWQDLPNKVKDNVVVLENGKWWLVDFVNFQCGGEVSDSTTNRAHLSYLKQLKKHGLYERYKGLCRAINGTIDNDNDKELEKDKDKKEPDTELKPLVQYYLEKHKQVRGYEPTVLWPRDMKIMQTVRRGYKPEAIRQLLDMFFAWNGRSNFTLRAFADKVDTLYGVLKDKAEGKR